MAGRLCLNRTCSNDAKDSFTSADLPTDSKDSDHEGENQWIFGPPKGRTEVQHLSMLKPGDHIMWKRLYGVDHHAIVEKVDADNNKLHVIHNSASAPGRKGLGLAIFRETVDVNCSKECLYRIDYDLCHSAKVVLERAITKLGQNLYNAFTYNCEHFAQWCKRGQAFSDQVKKFKGFAFDKVRDIATCVSKEGLKVVLKRVAAPEAAVLAGGAASAAGSNIFKKVAGGVARNANRIGVGLVVCFEIYSTGKGIYDSYQEMKKGNITRDDFETSTMENLCEGACGVAGTVIGSILGAGAIGAVVGTTLGALLGRWAGRVLGRGIQKIGKYWE